MLFPCMKKSEILLKEACFYLMDCCGTSLEVHGLPSFKVGYHLLMISNLFLCIISGKIKMCLKQKAHGPHRSPEQLCLKIKKLDLIHEICNIHLWQNSITMKNNYLLIQSTMAMTILQLSPHFVLEEFGP